MRVNEVIAVPEAVACSVADMVEAAIAVTEQTRAPADACDPAAWRLYQRGLWHFRQCNPADNARARHLLQRAVDLNPAFAKAYSALAMIGFHEAFEYGAPGGGQAGLAERWACEAIRLEPGSADGRANLALVTLAKGYLDDAWKQLDASGTDQPNLPWASGVSGAIHLYAGYTIDARARLRTALASEPRDPRNAVLMTQTAISYYLESRYEESLGAARRAIMRYPDYPIPYRWIALALGQLGQSDLAREALAEAVARLPDTFGRYERGPPSWMRPPDHEHVLVS